MSIYHASAKIISRGSGQSSVASASYRSGEILHDEFYNKTYDYTDKKVDDTFILAPEGSPNWVYNREKLWNEVEKREIRKDSQLAREFNFALPKELSKQSQIDLVIKFVKENFIEIGMIADVCFHLLAKNPHVHIMLTMRKLIKHTFGMKIRTWNKKGLLKEWRKNWAKVVNVFLKRNKIADRVDHRSFKDRNLEKLPTVHLGWRANNLERQGIKTERGNINREVQKYNKNIIELKKYQVEKVKLIENIEKTIEKSLDRQEFINHMQKQGYEVKWENDDRYITYITPDGEVCKDINLPKHLNIDELSIKLNNKVLNIDDSIKKLTYKIDDLDFKKYQIECKIERLQKQFFGRMRNKEEIKTHREEIKKFDINIKAKKDELSRFEKVKSENKVQIKDENKKLDRFDYGDERKPLEELQREVKERVELRKELGLTVDEFRKLDEKTINLLIEESRKQGKDKQKTKEKIKEKIKNRDINRFRGRGR